MSAVLTTLQDEVLTVTLNRPDSLNAMEDRNQVLTAHDANFAEGPSAFLERRKPDYR